VKTRSILKITILGCLAFSAAGLFSGATTGAEARSSAPTAVPKLVKCSGLPEVPSARCGSIRVPLDRANPSLGTTKIAFALVPRRDTARPPVATVVLSGGPAIAAAPPFVQGVSPLRGRRDVLLIDQRGSGRSEAIACRAFRGFSFDRSSRAELIGAVGACGRELGPRVGAYGTAAAADDIEAVRAWLAIDRLDLWGSSYSTYLMTVYAARHPAHVRSIVMNGAYPIQFDPWALDRLAAARRAIGLVCTRTRACRGEAVLRDVGRLAMRLRSHPVSFAVSAGTRRIPLRLDEAALATLVYAGNDATAYGRIPAAVASALDGDLAPLRRLVESSAAPFDVSGASSEAQGFALGCHDYPRVFSYADAPAARQAVYLRARGAIDPRALWPFSAAAWTATQLESVDSCLQWPDDQTAAAPFPPGTPMPDVPVLVLSGDLDANTPSSAGRQAAGQYPRASFVEIPNVGHTPESSPCAVALGLRFVATLKVNARACVGTGAPPPVAGRAPRLAADLPLVRGEGTPAERRALALVVATVADLQEQSPIVAAWGAASALRGGRYVAVKRGDIRLAGARVVRDGSISGVLSPAEGQTAGSLRLAGGGVTSGRLRVSLTAAGKGHATGVLDGHRVDLAFRL
jgi:pimeloyl-ACP methyl ester carboxylesterase